MIHEVLQKILTRSAHILQLEIDDPSLNEIATRARGTPRTANNLLRWVRDYAQVHTGNKVDKDVVDKALKMLAIDERGLDEMDKKILSVIGGSIGGMQVLEWSVRYPEMVVSAIPLATTTKHSALAIALSALVNFVFRTCRSLRKCCQVVSLRMLYRSRAATSP